MKLGSQLTYSTTSHPRTNGRSEVVNESVRNLLHCLAGVQV